MSIANSQTEAEFNNLVNYLKSKEFMNANFLKYFEKHLEIRQKWVFCYIDKESTFNRTNLHIESWHRILKYDFLNGKKNKRCDALISSLMRLSEEFEYKMNLSKFKGRITTFKRKVSERHSLSKKRNINLLENDIIQVLLKNTGYN